MKTVIIFLMIVVSSDVVIAQENDTVYDYRCNTNWLDELIKTDTISEENRKQDYMCYMGLFDSLEKETKYTKLELLQTIGKLAKYSDGAFSEGLFHSAFQYVDEHTNSFFLIMEKGLIEKTLQMQQGEAGIKNWALMIYFEYGNRSPKESGYAEDIISEFENKLKNKKLKSWTIFKKEIKLFEENRIKK